MNWRLVPLLNPESSFPKPADFPPELLQLSGEAILVRDPPPETPSENQEDINLFLRDASLAQLKSLTIQIISLLATPDPNPFHYRIARMVLEEEGIHAPNPDPLAVMALAGARSGHSEGLDHLARMLAGSAVQIQQTLIEVLASDIPVEALHGIFALDHIFAEWIEKQFSESGKQYARLIRAESQTRWNRHAKGDTPLLGRLRSDAPLYALWVDPTMRPLPARWPRGLCRALWWAATRPRLEQARRRLPVVSGPLFDSLFRIHRPGVHLATTDNGMVLRDVQEVTVATFQPATPLRIAAVQLGTALHLAQTGAGMLGSLNAHRLLDWMIPEAHHRAANNEPDARTLVIEGGWSALANIIGVTSKKSIDDLHAIVAAMAHTTIALPDQSIGNLLAYRDVPARGRRASTVEIVLGTALMPNYVHELQGEDRILIPWPPAVPLVGRPNEYGAQRALRLRLLIELRKRAREMVATGGIHLTDEEWALLAQEATLPLPVLQPVMDRWTQDGEDGPAFLKRIDRNCYTLGDAHLHVRSFLEDAGRMAEAGAQAGRKSVEIKRNRFLRKKKHTTYILE